MGQTIKHFSASTSDVDLSSLDRVEQLSGETAQGYYFRATARYKVGRYREAANDYGKALELDPTMTVAGELQRVAMRQLNAK